MHRHSTLGRNSRSRLILVWLCLLLSGPASAAEVEEKIESQREAIEATEAQRESARAELETHREAMERLERRVQALGQERAALEERRDSLDAQEAKLRQGLSDRQAELERRLRAAYPLTRGGALKALLAEGDILQARRDFHYIKHLIEPIQQARLDLQKQQAALERNHQAISATAQALDQAGEQLDQHQEQLAKNLARQESLLARLGETLDQQQMTLQALLQKKKRLDREVAAARAEAQAQAQADAKARAERALQEKRTSASSAPARTESRVPGALALSSAIPIDGVIERHYGDSISNGQLRNEGVIFRAQGGQPVRAIDTGTVAFAGTLKGWGKLVMLRHRDDYLSLYAHCRTVNVNKGDRVETGTQVCESGTVDADRHGLYVEVRRGSRPIDPGRWPAWQKAAGS